MKLLFFIQKHTEELTAVAVGGGSFSLLMMKIEFVLKVLVAASTFIYFIIKIRKELKNK